MDVLWFVLPLAYFTFASSMYLYWKNLPLFSVLNNTPQDTFLSVVIVIRNEEENILSLLEDLERQDYPKHLFEVLVVDDASTDRGPDLIRRFHATYHLQMLSVPAHSGTAPKKIALTKGIHQAKGALICITDGDCRIGSKWLSTIQYFYKAKGSKFIFGGVTFHEENSLFERMQVVEFASLTGSGAACLQAGYPNMCNGANLAFEKSIFEEVEGYKGYDHLPSGDDEFLMHKIYRLYPKQVHFLKSKDAVVLTKAKPTFKEFVQQRKRWAGKWKYYQFQNIKWIAFFIFLCNAFLIIALGMTLAGLLSPRSFFLLLGIKLLPDYFFIRNVLQFYNKENNFFIFIATAVFYPFYVSFFAITSRIGKYTWKGRNF